MNPLVSIIIPTYNFAAFLPECLNSVLVQSYPNWECIIIDDGSTDLTGEIIEPYLKDKRFIYFRQANKGLSASRNKGIELSSGDYIQFLDADDKLLPEKLQIQLLQLKDSGKEAVSISDFSFSDTGRKKFNRFITTQYLKEYILRVNIPPVCFLFSSFFFKTLGLRYDTTLTTHEDWDMIIRILNHSAIVKISDRVLCIYRVHENSMTSTLNMKEGLKTAVRNSLALFPGSSDEYHLLKIRKQLADWHSTRYRFPHSLLHSFLLRYAVWRYL